MPDGKINLIFDCDGTLIDSYEAIIDRECRLFREHDIICNPAKIRELSLLTSVNESVKMLASQIGLDGDALIKEIHALSENRSLITLFDGVKEVLANSKFRFFVYTHRGPSCKEIFETLGILDFFEEIVDRTYGFKRKPDSEGVDYLVNKYSLDKNNTFYVGDRALDIECGKNAGIKTIFFNSSALNVDTSKADYVINSFDEINSLF